MELASMFTEQKWNIIKALSENKYSPLQLAEKLDTTMANISQQLRLLEASNIVKKEKKPCCRQYKKQNWQNDFVG